MVRDHYNRPLRDLRLSVIDACNFRCPYCMPVTDFPDNYKFLPKREWLSFDEMVRFCRLFVTLGVSKIRITGGEPLLRRHLPELIQRLDEIDGIDDIALTTNGYYLARDAAALKAAGLHRLNVSLDAVDASTFAKMNGQRASLSRVLDGLDAARFVGFESIKINTVVRRGINDTNVLALAEYCREQQFILRFIEYMDVGTRNAWERADVVPSAEIRRSLNTHFPLEPLAKNYDGEVMDRFRYVDGGGEIGFISSVTEPFCGGCHRARLSSNGRLFTCLFAADGIDLRTPLRDGASDEDLSGIIRGAWLKRRDQYSVERVSTDHEHRPKVEMNHIGG